MNNLLFDAGYKKKNFVVFNPLNLSYTDEEPELSFIKLDDSKFWDNLKSAIWSSNGNYGFVVAEDGITIIRVYDDIAIHSNNLSSKVFEMFI